MQSEGTISADSLKELFSSFFYQRWNALKPGQKALAKKAWGVITYKWRWQIAMNVPYLIVFCLDRTIPAVHEFDLALISSVTSKLPIPQFITSSIGIS